MTMRLQSKRNPRRRRERSNDEPYNLLIIGASSSVNTLFPDLSPEFHPIVAEFRALCKKKMLDWRLVIRIYKCSVERGHSMWPKRWNVFHCFFEEPLTGQDTGSGDKIRLG